MSAREKMLLAALAVALPIVVFVIVWEHTHTKGASPERAPAVAPTASTVTSSAPDVSAPPSLTTPPSALPSSTDGSSAAPTQSAAPKPGHPQKPTPTGTVEPQFIE
jgi:hypothetical protein